MAIVQYWIDLEMDMRNQLHFEIGLFVPEYKRLDNGKTITLKHEIEPGVIWQVRNDALFTIVNVLDGREYLFLLEIDRGTMPIQADSSRIADCIGRPSNRSSVERKLHKIQKLLSVSHEVFPSLGSSFRHFRGARVIIVTSSSQRVCNIIKTIKLHPELLQQQVFLFSIVDETRKGAFNCRYAVPTGEANQLNTLRGLHICL